MLNKSIINYGIIIHSGRVEKKNIFKKKKFSAKKVAKYFFVDQSNKSFMQILIV